MDAIIHAIRHALEEGSEHHFRLFRRDACVGGVGGKVTGIALIRLDAPEITGYECAITWGKRHS